MRNQSPEVLAVVRRSILETVVPILVFINLFIIYIRIFQSYLDTIIQILALEVDWRSVC